MQQRWVLLAFWREIQLTDVCKANVPGNLTERFEVIFCPLDEEQAHGATK